MSSVPGHWTVGPSTWTGASRVSPSKSSEAGSVAVMSVSLTTLNGTDVPPMVTPRAPVKYCPLTVMVSPPLSPAVAGPVHGAVAGVSVLVHVLTAVTWGPSSISRMPGAGKS
jgi:hypothetical protein